jgi:hypothetical protein
MLCRRIVFQRNSAGARADFVRIKMILEKDICHAGT